MRTPKPKYDKRFPMPTTQTLTEWAEYMMRHAQEAELTKSLQDFDGNANYDRAYNAQQDAN